MADALNVHVFGADDAPPLLALHGVTGHGARFRRLAQWQLSAFRVIAPDLRGHGDSPRLPPWTLEQHTADVLAVMDTFGLQRVSVMAHSFGALIALRLPPDRVGALVLLDPAVSVKPREALESAEAAKRECSDPYAAQRQDWPTAEEDVIAEEVSDNWVTKYGVWSPKCSPAAVATAWSEMCRPVPLPRVRTLVVRALRARYVGPEFLAAARGVELVDLDCGHMVTVEEPDRVGGLVSGFVR
ncbi:alpha/beta hydrolase [Actinokineospora sp. NBRC 105648]|uniref:alpha/beta fold hydrolase n=1 Tax=Actinokineospora sp. NBRC 105648 TaxID=3032206 RepID=UPI0024A55F9E|nr:alpha/beta hydrolase [Actinokineospora sp. NBRC 105648]GLZ40509.1 lipase LipV [Actinokineospora sp. NBRC 105648]